MIDRNFLEKNLFVEATVGPCSFPWRYEDKNYTVILNPWTDSGRPWILINNYETRKEMKFYSEPRLTKADLRKCIEFMQVPDEFDYE